MSRQRDAEGRRTGWASTLFIPPVAALQFLTLAPPVVHRRFTSEEMGRAVAFFPLVGALLGGLLGGLSWGLAHLFAVQVASALVLATSVVATGALHLDGFLDACDGILGGYTPESRLDIMRDERVGAFGVAGGVLLLLLKFAALSAVPNRIVALLLALTLARWGIALAIVLFPYARPDGLGRSMKDHAGWKQIALATATALVVSWVGGDGSGLLAMALAGATAWIVARFVLKRVPGLTGDIYGAIAETVECIVLLFLSTGVKL